MFQLIISVISLIPYHAYKKRGSGTPRVTITATTSDKAAVADW